MFFFSPRAMFGGGRPPPPPHPLPGMAQRMPWLSDASRAGWGVEAWGLPGLPIGVANSLPYLGLSDLPPGGRLDNHLGVDMSVYMVSLILCDILLGLAWFGMGSRLLTQVRIRFLSPSLRLSIALLYGTMRISLVRWAFWDTPYYYLSWGAFLVHLALAVLAMLFDRGPLKPWKSTRRLTQQVRRRCHYRAFESLWLWLWGAPADDWDRQHFMEKKNEYLSITPADLSHSGFIARLWQSLKTLQMREASNYRVVVDGATKACDHIPGMCCRRGCFHYHIPPQHWNGVMATYAKRAIRIYVKRQEELLDCGLPSHARRSAVARGAAADGKDAAALMAAAAAAECENTIGLQPVPIRSTPYAKDRVKVPPEAQVVVTTRVLVSVRADGLISSITLRHPTIKDFSMVGHIRKHFMRGSTGFELAPPSLPPMSALDSGPEELELSPKAFDRFLRRDSLGISAMAGGAAGGAARSPPPPPHPPSKQPRSTGMTVDTRRHSSPASEGWVAAFRRPASSSSSSSSSSSEGEGDGGGGGSSSSSSSSSRRRRQMHSSSSPSSPSMGQSKAQITPPTSPPRPPPISPSSPNSPSPPAAAAAAAAAAATSGGGRGGASSAHLGPGRKTLSSQRSQAGPSPKSWETPLEIVVRRFLGEDRLYHYFAEFQRRSLNQAQRIAVAWLLKELNNQHVASTASASKPASSPRVSAVDDHGSGDGAEGHEALQQRELRKLASLRTRNFLQEGHIDYGAPFRRRKKVVRRLFVGGGLLD